MLGKLKCVFSAKLRLFILQLGNLKFIYKHCFCVCLQKIGITFVSQSIIFEFLDVNQTKLHNVESILVERFAQNQRFLKTLRLKILLYLKH